MKLTVQEFSMLPLQSGLNILTPDGIGTYEGITSSGLVKILINGGMKDFSWVECEPKIMLRHILIIEDFVNRWKDQYSQVTLLPPSEN